MIIIQVVFRNVSIDKKTRKSGRMERITGSYVKKERYLELLEGSFATLVGMAFEIGKVRTF